MRQFWNVYLPDMGDSVSFPCTDHNDCQSFNLTAEKCNNEGANEIDYKLTCPKSCESCDAAMYLEGEIIIHIPRTK